MPGEILSLSIAQFYVFYVSWQTSYTETNVRSYPTLPTAYQSEIRFEPQTFGESDRHRLDRAIQSPITQGRILAIRASNCDTNNLRRCLLDQLLLWFSKRQGSWQVNLSRGYVVGTLRRTTL